MNALPVLAARTQDKNSPSNSSESLPQESSLSNDTDKEVEDVLQDVTVDGDGNLVQHVYQTKAGKLIERSLGKTRELGQFDRLRVTMKSKMHQKQKPTALQKHQYETITVILNTQVIVVKLDLKLRVKTFEKIYYRTHGVFPERGTNTEYYKDL